MSVIELDIIIPVYQPNIPEVFNACIDSVVRNTSSTYRLIVAASGASMPVNINEAMSSCRSSYIALLDWDVEVPVGWDAALLSVLEQHQEVGMVGGGLVPNNWYEKYPGSYCGEIPTLAGGCMLMRNRYPLVRFDESFPHGWYSDTDLCRQYKAFGYKLYLNNRVRVKHHVLHSTSIEEPDHSVNQALCEAVYRAKWGSLDV